jgi:hypothetical protein
MDRKNTIRIIALIAIVISLSIHTDATASVSSALTGIFGAVGKAAFLVGELVTELIKFISKGWIIATAYRGITFLEGIFDNIENLISTNPPMSEIFPGMLFFMKIIAPLYILAIVALAIYFLIGSGSASNRAKARSMLSKLLISLVLVSISPAVLSILFAISENLVKALLSIGAATGISMIREASGGLWYRFWTLVLIHREGGLEIFALESVMITGLMALLLFRHVMVILLGMLMPLSLLLYSFHPTKHVGKDLLIQIFLWTFVPVFWALSLVILGYVAGNVPYIPDFYVFMGAFFFFMSSPMLIMGLGDFLGTLVFMFELLQAAPLSIGAVVLDETMK